MSSPDPALTLVAADEVDRAAARFDRLIRSTPLLECETLGAELGCRVLVKAENLQHTGSFKLRGALNACLARRERGVSVRGVAAFSAGNHAAATAFAASVMDVPAVVCMRPDAVSSKVGAVRRYGGEIVFTEDLVSTCQAVCDERGYELVHPFDDPDVIAGQATVGREVRRDLPEPDLIVLPTGGGGLLSGVAAAVKPRSPQTRIVGVEPETANAVSHALRAGSPEPLPRPAATVADGLAAPFTSARVLAHVKALVDEVVELPEERILPALWPLMEATKLLVEPSAAVGLAAVLDGAVDVPRGGTLVLVLSGGNVSPDLLSQLPY